MKKFLCLAVVSFFLSACGSDDTPDQVAEPIIETQTSPKEAASPEVKRLADLAYGEHERQTFDLYAPNNPKTKIILFLQGGNWTAGEKEQYQHIGKTLGEAGYITMIPNYRRYPEVTYPSFTEDAIGSIAWIRENAKINGEPPNEIVVMGYGNGAHTAAMLAANGAALHNANIPYESLAGIIPIAGAYDLWNDETLSENWGEVFGDFQNNEKAMPSSYFDGTEPPFLILHGEKDDIISPYHSRTMEAALINANADVTSEYYPEHDHVSIITDFNAESKIFQDIVKFLAAEEETEKTEE